MKNVILFAIGLMGWQFGQAQNLPTSQERLPVIDMHMHTGLPHEIPEGVPALCRPEPCIGDGHAVTDPKIFRKKTLELMDKYNVVKGFLSGVDLPTVLRLKEDDPDRFLASPFILHPNDEELKNIRKAYLNGQIQGMGEIGTQLLGIPPNDPALDPYFTLAEELDLPVLIHVLGIGPYMPHFSVQAGNPLLLEEVLKKHPKLRLFVENAGYPYQDEMIAVMYQYPQLYVDVSTITWVIPRTAFYDYLEGFIRAGLGKRIMYGSDQMAWPEKIGESIEAIEQAPFLTHEQKRDILYHNAARFLRLESADASGISSHVNRRE